MRGGRNGKHAAHDKCDRGSHKSSHNSPLSASKQAAMEAEAAEPRSHFRRDWWRSCKVVFVVLVKRTLTGDRLMR